VSGPLRADLDRAAHEGSRVRLTVGRNDTPFAAPGAPPAWYRDTRPGYDREPNP
jgi:hypothetical protein